MAMLSYHKGRDKHNRGCTVPIAFVLSPWLWLRLYSNSVDQHHGIGMREKKGVTWHRRSDDSSSSIQRQTQKSRAAQWPKIQNKRSIHMGLPIVGVGTW